MTMLFTEPLKQNRDFKRLYARGKSAASQNLVVYCRRKNAEINRLGITVGGKIGKAVVRNRIRRRIKESYRLNETAYKQGFDIVVVARSRAMNAPFSELRKELDCLFKRLNMRKQE